MNCALCNNNSILCMSHLLPNFVFRYMKDTSFTGRFTDAINPNLPRQNGKQYKMLCEDCEQRFSRYEKYFKENIFIKYHKKENLHFYSYNNYLLKFIISVNWRILYQALNDPDKKPLPNKYLEILNKTEHRWRYYLLDKNKSPKNPVNCLMFLDYISDYTGFKADEIPNNINRYLGRAVDGTIVFNKANTELWVYSKLIRIAFVSVIKGNLLNDWEDTIIKNANGNIKVKQNIASLFGYFLFKRVNELNPLFAKRSIKQKTIIRDKQINDFDTFISTETGESLFEDFKLKQLKILKSK